MQNFGLVNHFYNSLFSLTHFPSSLQVCDSDTMLDPASSVEMVKVLEEDPMVGGVGGDVQVCGMALLLPESVTLVEL